jgi:hypothetical protein
VPEAEAFPLAAVTWTKDEPEIWAPPRLKRSMRFPRDVARSPITVAPIINEAYEADSFDRPEWDWQIGMRRSAGLALAGQKTLGSLLRRPASCAVPTAHSGLARAGGPRDLSLPLVPADRQCRSTSPAPISLSRFGLSLTPKARGPARGDRSQSFLIHADQKKEWAP